MAAALVLGTRNPWTPEDEFLYLHGRTSSHFPIKMVVSDGGKLGSFDTRVSVRCPDDDPYTWRWFPGDGAPVPFHQTGTRFYVRERSEWVEDPPVTVVSVMRGELEDSRRVARGTISSRAVWRYAAGTVACKGRASFLAHERD